MKKLTGLLLAAAVGLAGLTFITPARGQQVASAGGSISKLKEEYERLLAVERSPETPADVRELNRTFIRERRGQLASALRGRISTLRNYYDNLSATLSDAEKRAVEGSIRRLSEELRSLRAEQEGPIEITSPAEDRVVRVGEVEVEVRVGDEDVDDLMVAVYTPASEKPASARVLNLRRSDRGMKSVVVALAKGDNRIEVSDLKRPEVKAERRLTFTPPDAPSLGRASVASNVAAAAITPAATRDATKFTLCGQLTPESLNQTIGMVKSSDEFQDIAGKFLDPNNALRRSALDDDCDTNPGVVDGAQKEAYVVELKDVARRIGAKGFTPPDEFNSLSAATVRRQVLLLNQYFGNVAVRVTKENGDIVAIGFTGRDGNFFFDNIDPAQCSPYCSVSTEADNYQTRRKFTASAGGRQRVNIVVDDQPVSLLARAVVGYEQTGASSAKREQTYFFDLFLRKSMPFMQKINPDFGERFSTWGNVRFTSVPQPGNTALGTFISNFSQQAANVEVKDVARVFDFLAGVEIRLTGNNRLLPSFDRQTKQKFSLSFIAGGGSITPLDSRETLATFRVFPDAPGLPPEARGKEFVSFIAADRDRFFRQYFVGLRVQTFFFNKYNIPMQRFPAQLDLTIGQNEFVTGGKLRGPVIRVEGYYPLPYDDLNFINLFATAQLKPGSSGNNLPLVLQPAPADATVPSANTVLVLAPQPNRDYYRAGVGIDFISFLGALRRAGSQ
jgi:hypothetical protein